METSVGNFLSDFESLRKYYRSHSILGSPGDFVRVYYLWKIIENSAT